MKLGLLSRNSFSKKRFCVKTVCSALVLAGVVAGASTAKATLLLSDNFTAPTNMMNDANQNLAGRQLGTLAPLTYSTNGGNVQTGNTTTMRSNGDGNYLLFAGDGKASLNQDFNGALSQGGLTISFDVYPEVVVGSDNWSSFDLGEAVGNRFLGVNQDYAHLGLLFRANGQFGAFDGTTDLLNGVGGSYVDAGQTVPGGQDNYATITLQITDADNNPFDGNGGTTIKAYTSLYSNGSTPFFSFTKIGGYSDNYLTLSSTHVGGFDNLSITEVTPAPEPMSIGTLLLGGLALLGRRSRRIA